LALTVPQFSLEFLEIKGALSIEGSIAADKNLYADSYRLDALPLLEETVDDSEIGAITSQIEFEAVDNRSAFGRGASGPRSFDGSDIVMC
jgi:hypothetical protein